MTNRATEKITEALSQLFEGFAELQDLLETELGTSEVEDEKDEKEEDEGDEKPDPESALIREMKTAIEVAIETEDYTPEEIATVIATMTEALEEIDPDVFEGEDEEGYADEEEEDDDLDVDYDDDDDDLDDLDDDEDDDLDDDDVDEDEDDADDDDEEDD